MTGTDASVRLEPYTQFEVAPAAVALPVATDGTWRNAGIFVDLPAAGTYFLGHDLRTNMTTAGNGNSHTQARLYDNTVGLVVPGSVRLVQQHDTNLSVGDQTITSGGNGTAAAQVLYTVTGPRRIYSQAAYFNTSAPRANFANIIQASIVAYLVRR